MTPSVPLTSNDRRRLYEEEQARQQIRSSMEAEARVHAAIRAIRFRPKRSRRLAGVLSLLLPGAGQVYKGQILSALLWLAGTVGSYIVLPGLGLTVHLTCIFDAVAAPPAALKR